MAVPAVQVVAVGKLFAAGIVVKTGHALERLSEITDVIFDKTGTLTQCSQIGNTIELNPTELALFASVAQHSSHPATSHLRRQTSQHTVQDIVEIVGEGISGRVDNVDVRLGRRAYVSEDSTDDTSGLWGLIEGRQIVELSADEVIRPEAQPTVSQLTDFGLGISLVSGDTEDRVNRIARTLGIQDIHARIRPAGKSDIVVTRQSKGAKILMVGDGINDAPALSHAHASAALASASDISRATADIVLRNDSLSGLPYAIKMACAARRAVLQNFGFAAAYNLLAVPLAVAGLVTPLLAALAMSLSSIVVTLNALRLNRLKAEPTT